MPVVVVVNPKGGVGKSTVSTNVAGYFASKGAQVMLGDVDKQQTSRWWLEHRPANANPIHPWDIDDDHKLKVPKGVTHVVLDTPAVNRPGSTRHSRAAGSDVFRIPSGIPPRRYCGVVWGCRTSRCS